MAVIDLECCAPDELAESARLADLLETVRSIATWSERQAEVLDHVYRHRLVRLLWRRAAVEELRTLSEHLARVAHPRRLAALDALALPYGARWQGYRQLLETRLAGLVSEAPAQLLRRAHVPEILRLVCGGGVTTQKDLQEVLGLGKANLTRVLKMMEANELIVRTSEGRENRLAPGANAERFLPKSEPASPRGRSFLLDKRAAG